MTTAWIFDFELDLGPWSSPSNRADPAFERGMTLAIDRQQSSTAKQFSVCGMPTEHMRHDDFTVEALQTDPDSAIGLRTLDCASGAVVHRHLAQDSG